MTKISVIIPCYNASQTITETLDSLMAQTVTDWEAICIDDGSTDDTLKHLRRAEARDRRIVAFHRRNAGPSAARNAGISVAKGEIIAFLDADDIWLPEKLAYVTDVLANNPAADGVFGRVSFVDRANTQESTQSTVAGGALSLEAVLGENPSCTLSNLTLRRAVLKRIGGFSPNLRAAEDVEWLVRAIAGNAQIVGDDRLHIRYRAVADGLSSDLMAMYAGWERVVSSFDAPISGVMLRRARAKQLRYLARRALRLGHPPKVAFSLGLRGLATAPAAFLGDGHRGRDTLLGCLCAPMLPDTFRRRLFA